MLIKLFLSSGKEAIINLGNTLDYNQLMDHVNKQGMGWITFENQSYSLMHVECIMEIEEEDEQQPEEEPTEAKPKNKKKRRD